MVTPDPEQWGIARGFEAADRQWREASPETVAAILAAMGATPGGPGDDPVLTVRLDKPPVRLPRGQLELEDGATVNVDGALPPDVPAGYHRLQPDAGPPLTVIASPGRCPLPDQLAWGFAAQLYATRSRSSWGFGDLADLRRLGEWSGGLGAGFVIVNPLHASGPTLPQQPSPYFPGSRCFLNPLYLRVEAVPGAASRPDIAELAGAGRRLNDARLIDRDRVWSLKSTALEALFEPFAGDPGFDAFLAARGAPLQGFATFCALAERHGAHWQSWPSDLHDPAAPAVREFVASAVGAARVRFHLWLQWLVDGQLRHAANALPVVSDLAVGVDPGGADAWLWQDAFVAGMRVGAPPDRYNTLGQNWALPPFDPWRLRAAAYRPWIESLRGALRHGGGLRVDHVMGLFRLYWIPDGAPPAAGAYVRYPHHDLLNIVALEAARAGAFVVGEDLGTVERGVRRELAERNLLSYKLWWFQRDRPRAWPAKALGAVSTHDLPTIAGVLSGSDLEAQRRLDLHPNEVALARLRAKLTRRTKLTGRARAQADTDPAGELGPEDVIARVHADLAEAPCILLTASLDDAVAVEERPNLPGTIDEWPNWRLALPFALEDIEQLPLPRTIAASFRRRRG
ncbi:MAG TPA: 4-alpha-glucanotransferase [Acidimicrobiales bacterium]|jgi:4-alpha-glucanotransferase